MPKDAAVEEVGRPVPKKLEIEVLKKFMRFDAQYSDDKKQEFPDLVKPPPPIGAAGCGGVEWVGLNQDPCKAKYLAKIGIVRETAQPGQPIKRGKRPKKGEKGEEPRQELVKKGFSLGSYLSTAPLPYPHWQGELHGPFEKPKTASVLSRSSSAPGTAIGDARSQAKSQCSKRTSMRSSAVTDQTRASIADAVKDEVQRQLEKISCHEHYIEQTKNLGFSTGVPCCVKPAPTPADLRELIYYDTSQEEQGKHAYLYKRHRIMPQERNDAPQTSAGEVGWKAFGGKGVWVGKMLERMKPPPDTLEIC